VESYHAHRNDKDATDSQIQAVVAKIESLNFEAQPMPGGARVAIAILRNPGPVDSALFVDMPGVNPGHSGLPALTSW